MRPHSRSPRSLPGHRAASARRPVPEAPSATKLFEGGCPTELAVAATPLDATPESHAILAGGEEETADMPSWLREAGDAMPACGASSKKGSPVSWGAIERLLEEKAALEELLREAHAEKLELVQRCEEVIAERDSEAERAQSLRAERATLHLQLAKRDEEIAALEKAELAAQVKLC